MTSTKPRVRVIASVFALLWAAGMVANLVTEAHPPADWVWVRAAGADDYPVVQGVLALDAVIPTQLETGDRVLRVAERDMRGRGQLGFLMTAADVAWQREDRAPIPFEVLRGGQRLTVMEPRRENRRDGGQSLFVASIWCAAALLVLVRAPASKLSDALFYAMATYGLGNLTHVSGPPPLLLVSIGVMFLGGAIRWPLLMRSFLYFSEDRRSHEGVHRWWPWGTAFIGPCVAVTLTGILLPPRFGRVVALFGLLVFVLLTIVALGVGYRRSGAVQRRRIKWVVYSTYVAGLLSIGTLTVISLSQQEPFWAPGALMLTSISFPIAVLVAIFADDLFDIDRLIGAAVAYNILIVVALGGAMVIVPQLTTTLVARLAVDPTVGQVGFALMLAGAMVAIQRRVRPQIDRLFFKERFAFERGMRLLQDRLATARGPRDLWSMTGEDLVTHLRPATCTVYTSAGTAFVPEYAAGEAAAPSVGTDTALVRWIAALQTAVKLPRKVVRGIGGVAPAFVANLEAQVVLPVHRAGKLEAFVCLGEKRSGDIYTRTDRVLLTALAKALSVHLLRFDEAELLERARQSQAKMRRYVPGAVAEEIDSGRDLEAGEREVSVLFVDIRDYTAFSDGRRASDVFSTVNRYTGTVSTIVRENGGAVVEFNGDGMLAVFGAPRPLPDKERSAVAAARRLVLEVPTIGGEGAEDALFVGVGVATGDAFVGNIESVDRTIWTAIGSTTNLAARLQALTRDLDAGVLIDETTHARVGADGVDFRAHRDVVIRGQKAPRTLFALPGAAPPPRLGHDAATSSGRPPNQLPR